MNMQGLQNVSDSLILTWEALGLGAVQKPPELLLFLESLKGKKLKVVVEIGTARGGVFYALCQAAENDAVLVSVDLPEGPYGGGCSGKDILRLRKYAKPGQTLRFIQQDSHLESTKRELWEAINKEKIDLLFIDGDHTYNGVKQDWELYSPLVRTGGMIVFHDICFHPTMPDVQVNEFWGGLKVGKNSVEFIDSSDRNWGGIGVITL